MKSIWVLAFAFSALALLPTSADAASTGNVAGTVTEQESGKPLAGVTVTVSGAALQGEQTEFTDSAGRYIITELPPGEYVVRFYFSNVKVERTGVFLNADKTLSVSAQIPTQTAKTQTYRIVEKAPTVDVGNTQVQTQITDELVRNTPVNGRNMTSVLTLAPGSAADAVGFSFNGATGLENNYLLDGMNTTSPSYGYVGSNFSLEFVKETEIITGGYNAEYGRATGGVVNVVTKSGSNEFHGGAWFFYTPFQLTPERTGRFGEAVSSLVKLDHSFDFGFDLGGPIVKDRIWFYAGLNPQFSTTGVERILRQRTANDLLTTQMGNSYAGDLDKSGACPAWLADKALCAPGNFKLTDLPSQYRKSYTRDRSSYNWIAKLNFQINENNQLSVAYLGTPSSANGGFGSSNGSDSQRFSTTDSSTHDVVAHFISKLLDRKLQLDVLLGYHYETTDTLPDVQKGGALPGVRDTRTISLYGYENDVTPCMPQMMHGVSFNPCPVQNYSSGGGGFQQNTRESRVSGVAGLTYFLRAGGTHAIKLGGDFEALNYHNQRGYTGDDASGVYIILGNGSVERETFASLLDKNGQMLPAGQAKIYPYGVTSSGPNAKYPGFVAETQTANESLYLRDSWNVGFVPGLTLNAGIRWEFQQVKDIAGANAISITDNIAPRLGFVYDFTRKGYSKIFASYGRFYESIPLDINDRQFSGEGLAIQAEGSAGQYCPKADMNGIIDITKCQFPTPSRPDVNGGVYGVVSPTLKGQYSNEIVAGIQYDVGYDTVLGASYIHRDLGRIIEDMSPDGGVNYIIANPGEPTDPGVVAQIQGDIDSLRKQIDATTDMTKKTDLQNQYAKKAQALYLYKGVGNFDAPKRDYDALVLTANKRFSHNFILLASYTYSRTTGNYPGLYQDSNGQIDPNISTQYDLKELLINRYGPLQNDRPHNLKLTGAYTIPMGPGGINIGLTFNATSGTPIEVLGRHPTYGSNETFLLQRGSGGRTPTITSLDLRLAYGRQFSRLLRVDVTWDIFNVLDEHAVTSVDQTWTADRVLPIANGTYADLANLKQLNGTGARVNADYGHPTSYQLPLSMRFGIRVSF